MASRKEKDECELGSSAAVSWRLSARCDGERWNFKFDLGVYVPGESLVSVAESGGSW